MSWVTNNFSLLKKIAECGHNTQIRYPISRKVIRYNLKLLAAVLCVSNSNVILTCAINLSEHDVLVHTLSL